MPPNRLFTLVTLSYRSSLGQRVLMYSVKKNDATLILAQCFKTVKILLYCCCFQVLSAGFCFWFLVLCSTPYINIPASPFMQKLGFGTGVNVYLMKRWVQNFQLVGLRSICLRWASFSSHLKATFQFSESYNCWSSAPVLHSRIPPGGLLKGSCLALFWLCWDHCEVVERS